MINKIKKIMCIIWIKIMHPYIITSGSFNLDISTEIKCLAGGKLKIGNNVATQKRVTFSVVGGDLTIGNNTSFNRNDLIVCHDTIVIGNNCAFGPNVVIYDHDHKYDNLGYKSNEYNVSSVIIQDDCWIGANVTILRGTSIGQGSVIGAGTIVKGNIPPHSIVLSKRELSIQPIE